MPFNHIGVNVPSGDFDKIVDFYLRALAPLGYSELARPVPRVVGMGPDGKAELWLTKDPRLDGDADTPLNLHIALEASSK